MLKPSGVLAWAVGAKFCEYLPEWFGRHRLWTLTRFNRRRRHASGHSWVVQTRDQQPIEFPAKDSLIVYDEVRHVTRLHPCPKPPEEPAFLIDALTLPGQVVLEPFCGLGSTLVAAKRLGRRWRSSERSRWSSANGVYGPLTANRLRTRFGSTRAKPRLARKSCQSKIQKYWAGLLCAV